MRDAVGSFLRLKSLDCYCRWILWKTDKALNSAQERGEEEWNRISQKKPSGSPVP